MQTKQIAGLKKELIGFVSEFKPILGRSERLHWCETYLTGLLIDGERKSIQAMANRLPNGNEQALQQFVDQSPWSHQSMQLELAKFLLKKLISSKTSSVLVLDDTGLPKKGKHSVGVGRQYCGALGKVANCQSIVTWHFAGKEHFPLVGELYLSKSWCEDKSALKRKGVPEARYSFLKNGNWLCNY